ncbi:MAG: alanine--tRNA ligase [Defluviitaleaceae bacterium]|nr:alanine--tRNA ligase [Defluviitaleaceae bacterium]
MKYMTVNEIRETYLSFFEGKNHLRMPSFPLVPQNDNSLLLINSGMAPLKPYFTGRETPPSVRVTTCQKCVRTTDIEDVGLDVRHFSFFEMLGNFSFGDYFKREAIGWAWEFVTQVLRIPEDRLFITVFEADGDKEAIICAGEPEAVTLDEEAEKIWLDEIGIKKDRLFRLGKKENFWEHGTGPCGPCSEIHFDRGSEFCAGLANCANCRFGSPENKGPCEACDRYIEIWNLVFTQFNSEGGGVYSRLASRNIDTGMGLDRTSMVMQNAPSLYDIDTVTAVKNKICEIFNIQNEWNKSLMIITDHARNITFLASDGVLPSNEGRGYVFRRLLRRAVRHGRLLGRGEPFLASVCETVIDSSRGEYLNLFEKRGHILRVITAEEEKFFATLDFGTEMLSAKMAEVKDGVLPGADAFKLYDTYGFPPELMSEILAEQGLTYDEEGFQNEMERQKERGRAARGTYSFSGSDETVYSLLVPGIASKFTGYASTEADGCIVAAIVQTDAGVADRACDAQKQYAVFLSETPFYAESGGQKGDIGFIKCLGGKFIVDDCIKTAGGNIAHIGRIESGELKTGDKVTASVCGANRDSTARNHTATHLLHKALREVLGAHVEQAGSDVSAGRLRFDFTHFAALTHDDVEQAESIVNGMVRSRLPVSVTETDLAEARRLGAVMLFGEKYGESVRVVDVGGQSTELCGGTHIKNSDEIGMFKIISEGSAAAGVRRIEALTGDGALKYFFDAEKTLREVSSILKTEPHNAPAKTLQLLEENRQLKNETEKIKSKIAGGGADAVIKSAVNINGFDMFMSKQEGLDADDLRALCDKVRDSAADGIIILSSVLNGAAQFIARLPKAAVDAGLNAGELVKTAARICGGGGGGKPDAAQAGGKDGSRADEALQAAAAMVKKILGENAKK